MKESVEGGMRWKANWAETRRHMLDWWDHRGLVLGMWGNGFPGPQPLHDDAVAPPAPPDLETYHTDPDTVARRCHALMARSRFPADTLPIINPSIGTVELAAYLGAAIRFQEETLWYQATSEKPDPLRLDPNNPWYRRMLQTLRRSAAMAKGHYGVGLPAIAPGLDVLAELYSTPDLLVSLIERPEWVLGRLEEIDQVYFQVYDRFHEIVRQPDGSVFFYYFMLWGPGRVSMLQCDTAAMVSADMFRRFMVPSLRRCCDWLDHSLFHVDGPAMLKHLDALLEIESLDAIEFTPGAGVPRGGDRRWHDAYRRILAAGKSVQIVWIGPEDVEPLLDAVGPRGVYLMVECGTAEDMEQLAKTVERYR